MKIISCCINTHRRPELLRKLLVSINNQQLPEKYFLEIIVVDNDPSQLGKKIIEEVKPTFKFALRYFVQPIKNISITRNKAVSEAIGEYILFIDDDEYPESNWIINTVNCLEKYNADAVFGSVLSYFDSNTPDWIKSNLIFQRHIPKTGTVPKFTRSGNCLIKAETINLVDGPFDLEYGLTGGGDSFLFNILSEKGAKFVYCAESIVYEYVPSERANLHWLLKRSLRAGNSNTRFVINLAKNKFTTRVKLFFKAITFSLISLLLMIFNFPSRRKFIHWTLKLTGNIGHLMAIFNFHYVEYK